MAGLNRFLKENVKCVFIVMVLFAAVLWPLLHFNPEVLIGIVLGTAISLVNFGISAGVAGSAVRSGSNVAVFCGYIVRLPIYGAAFFVALKLSLICALGCGIGFICLPVSMFYLYGIRVKLGLCDPAPLSDGDIHKWNAFDWEKADCKDDESDGW